MKDGPVILVVETSGRVGSVGLAVGDKLLGVKEFTEPMRHSKEMFPATNGLLEQLGYRSEDIEQIYISVGPGSFTGLRIAVTMAKMMALANDVRIVAVDTLDMIAANVSCKSEKMGDTGLIGVILDAKRGQFFAAVYERKDGSWEKILDDCLMSSSEFVERFGGKGEGIWLMGEGLVYYKDAFEVDGISILGEEYWRPRAEKVHLLGWEKAQGSEFVDAVDLQPLYLRGVEALRLLQRRSGQAKEKLSNS